jgi:hypothetical protein
VSNTFKYKTKSVFKRLERKRIEGFKSSRSQPSILFSSSLLNTLFLLVIIMFLTPAVAAQDTDTGVTLDDVNVIAE